MSIREIIQLASFVLGLIPLVIIAVRWWWLGNWRNTSTGRAMMYLFGIFIIWAVLSVLTLAWPEPMRSEPGEWVRISIRLVTDVILWNVLRVFLRAQARPVDPPTPAGGIPTHG